MIEKILLNKANGSAGGILFERLAN